MKIMYIERTKKPKNLEMIKWEKSHTFSKVCKCGTIMNEIHVRDLYETGKFLTVECPACCEKVKVMSVRKITKIRKRIKKLIEEYAKYLRYELIVSYVINKDKLGLNVLSNCNIVADHGQVRNDMATADETLEVLKGGWENGLWISPTDGGIDEAVFMKLQPLILDTYRYAHEEPILRDGSNYIEERNEWYG